MRGWTLGVSCLGYVTCGLYMRVHLHMMSIDTVKTKVRAPNTGIPFKQSPELELNQTLL
jgi:hypothetical protein